MHNAEKIILAAGSVLAVLEMYGGFWKTIISLIFTHFATLRLEICSPMELEIMPFLLESLYHIILMLLKYLLVLEMKVFGAFDEEFGMFQSF